jgi:hypothetical protein
VHWRNAAAPENLRRIVHKATQKDPDQRYATAAAMAADLDRFLAGQPVEAPAYYFRLDDREVTAARPSPVVFAAITFFLIAFTLFLALQSFGLTIAMITPGELDATKLAIQTVIAVGILALGITVGRGILAARVWARWVGVGLSVLMIFASLFGMAAIGFFLTTALSSEAFTNNSPRALPSPDNQAGAEADQKKEAFSPSRVLLGTMAMYVLPLVVGLLLGCVQLWALLSRATAQWFRFARQLRWEHQQLRLSLSA